MRSLATLRKPPPPPAPVSVDAIVAVVGGTADELVKRFGSQGDDWLGRPTITFEEAQLVVSEWRRKQSEDVLLPARYDAYKEARRARLEELRAAARAKARAGLPNRGGAESNHFLAVQWQADREVCAAFEEAEPELTISQFRDLERSQT